MIALIIFILLSVTIVILIEWRERRRMKSGTEEQAQPQSADSSNGSDGSVCCGQHLVCERETLLNSSDQPVYYDDEELDALAGIDPELFTEQQHQQIADIFSSLREEDVSGWCRSLQLRDIRLPQDIREEALLIVRERRQR